MEPFLATLTKNIVTHYADAIGDLAIVLPNKRAGLFFRKYLSEELKKTTWAPRLFSIEEFAEEIAQLTPAEPADLLITLYEVHRDVESEKAQPFDEFITWGNQLIADFNEIDMYLADPERLYTYLDEVRLLTVWNPGGEELTDFQKQYLKFYHSMLPYYQGFKQRLLHSGTAYQGLIFKEACRKVQDANFRPSWKKVIFAGFNAMTTSEKTIIDWFREYQDADLLWDADHYYVEDPRQEAGLFLREWFKKWPKTRDQWIFDDFKKQQKDIQIIGVTDPVGQAKFTGSLLEKFPADLLNEKTAIILPDEQLLLPLLNALPESCGEVNITMGITLDETTLAHFFSRILDMKTEAFKRLGEKDKTIKYHYRDILEVMTHPLMQRLTSYQQKQDGFVVEEMMEVLRGGHQLFFGKEDLLQQDAGLFTTESVLLDIIFSQWQSMLQMLTGMQQLLKEIVDRLRREDPMPVELEYAFALSRILSRLHQIIDRASDYLTLNSLSLFFKQLCQQTRFPFFGEPLTGIQIMGMLETRNLDFERVILLSCNEGILPSGRPVQSFIPFDVRKSFNLPLLQQKDAVYAYHFYRLIQRAKEVWLLYITEPDSLGGGEPSRYIRQILQELPEYNPRIRITESVFTSPVPRTGIPHPISIPKTDQVYNLLIGKAKKGFAPTALNAYRSCPLRFYFKEIAGLKEPEVKDEEIDPRILGSGIHEALEQLYLPVTGKILSKPFLERTKKEVHKKVDEAFKKLFRGIPRATGKNLLLIEVANNLILRFIDHEIRYLETLEKEGGSITITHLERYLNRKLNLDLSDGPLEVSIKGVADRIDQVQGVIRIIDYKTGSVKAGELVIRDWHELLDNPDISKGFQLLIYAWLLHPDPDQPVTAGIIPFKALSKGIMEVKTPDIPDSKPVSGISTTVLEETECGLITLLNEIYDKNRSFTQTTDPEQCRHCPYKEFCCK